MTFELITENDKLWAVRYDGCQDNVLDNNIIDKDSFDDYMKEL